MTVQGDIYTPNPVSADFSVDGVIASLEGSYAVNPKVTPERSTQQAHPLEETKETMSLKSRRTLMRQVQSMLH